MTTRCFHEQAESMKVLDGTFVMRCTLPAGHDKPDYPFPACPKRHDYRQFATVWKPRREPAVKPEDVSRGRK